GADGGGGAAAVVFAGVGGDGAAAGLAVGDVPAGAVSAGAGGDDPVGPWMIQFLLGWWKLWVLAVAIPTVAALNAAKNAIRSRRDPFCIHCSYGLTGLPPEHT